MPDFPLRHLSVRAPWHDSEWKGVVCRAPALNGSCVKLAGIAGKKNDDAEAQIAGKSLEVLPSNKWPCCVAERAAFMAPFEMDQMRTHALAESSPKHYGHFQPTSQRCPAFSAPIVPFRWMMRDNMAAFRDDLEIDVDPEREPDVEYETNWVHDADNQKALLDGFAAHLREHDSLCLFYAKNVPFVEGTGRILLGVGRILQIGKLQEYKRGGEGMRGMLWERPIQHSIRPSGLDGFLMPYLELERCLTVDPAVDAERFVARAPEERWDEFSYASELVTHDGAIGALLSMDSALERSEHELGISTQARRAWINDELVHLWKVRGPYPGLGAVLTAFGISRGVFVAHELQHQAGENEDPWPLVESTFQGKGATLPAGLRRDIKALAPTWTKLTVARKSFLRLLSRFELTKDQAAALYEDGTRHSRGWDSSDEEILGNPYRLFELSRHEPDGVRLLTIDRGVFPEDAVRLRHPLEPPSSLESAVDLRRVRAFIIDQLEDAADSGHTLVSQRAMTEKIAGLPVRPSCPVTGDIVAARADELRPEVAPVTAEGTIALQLTRYEQIGDLVRTQVKGRVAGKRHSVDSKWALLLVKKFGTPTDEDEGRAQNEKAAALKELAEGRFSVLAGPAGAGKTSVLGILCAQSAIRDEGILLLAPTGKARVRMQELASSGGAQAKTIAQFLYQQGRYDGKTGRYVMSPKPKVTGFGTVIVDEASMLTEDMLGALLDALQGVKRLILVGDPAQLPPIGAGRPFVDVIAYLRPADYESRFPRVAVGYAELTVERRQIGQDRPDLDLARWFSTAPPAPASDDIFSSQPGDQTALRFVEWQKPEDFQTKLLDVLAEELHLSGPGDVRGFNREVGGVAKGDYDYFNPTRHGDAGSVKQVEAWQILSPLRGMPFGVGDINRRIHEHFRADLLSLASRSPRHIPKPFGAERIVYGDKVINLKNHRRDGRRVYPQADALGYLANGEIGIAVGQWKSYGSPKILKVEFSSQQGFTYDFYGSDFREEGDASLELAYALTVHKSQGSQFKLVIVVLPADHPILSRELIYTAITRHQDRVVVMHQGPRTILKDFAAPHRSATATRATNLLRSCKMQEIPLAKGSVFLQEGLVHTTSRGIAVRSKSELIIAEALSAAGIAFAYERPLTIAGHTRYPDFTIEDEASGRTVYWEHLGLLERKDYRRAWERKLAWYRANGVLPASEGEGARGLLVTTTESSAAGFDVGSVQATIREHILA